MGKGTVDKTGPKNPRKSEVFSFKMTVFRKGRLHILLVPVKKDDVTRKK